jgi:hypothetical protein
LETVGVDVVSSSLGDEVGVGSRESGDHCWVGGHIECAANDVTEEDLSAVSDGLDKGAEDSAANCDGEAAGEWGKGVGNGGNRVVNLRVDSLNESGDSGSIGMFRVFTDLCIHFVNLLLTVHNGSVDSIEHSRLSSLERGRGDQCKSAQKGQNILLWCNHC